MKSVTVDDTIVAIASAPGGAARGILRLSGPDVAARLSPWFQPRDTRDWMQARFTVAVPGAIRLGEKLLPCDLYYWPSARSYTGQPAAEIHTLGSPVLLQLAMRQLIGNGGVRLAEPGEFTLRAFLAGHIDLTQAEAVLGVIDATSREQLDTALAQLAGGISAPLSALRDQLLDLLADLEAGLDFVEEDISFVGHDELISRLISAEATVREIREQLQTRGRQTTEYRIVLTGAPNVGKSSLWNALLGTGNALVSPRPGTTRDYLTSPWQLNEWSCILIDTAGLDDRAAYLSPDRLAQQATAQQAQSGDVRVFCLDGSRQLLDIERAWLRTELGPRTLVVVTKSDMPRLCEYDGATIATSSRSGEGLAALRAAIAGVLEQSATLPAGMLATTTARCEASLLAAEAALAEATALAKQALGEELVAGELRVALEELGRVVGTIYTEDLLDRIFSRFCIGK